MWVFCVLWAIRCEGSHCRISHGDGTTVRGCVGGKLDIVLDETNRNLDLSDNNFTSLPANVFDKLGHLQWLDLSRNHFVSLESNIFDGLTNLLTLDLSRNHITSLESNMFDGVPYLMNLCLGNNHVTSLESNMFDRLTNLMTLDLSRNNITSLESNMFDMVPHLSRLNLSSNHFSSLESNMFDGQTYLITLDLSHNHITSLESNIFDSLTYLRKLDLSHNHITSLESNIFSGLTNLHTLDLSHNHITSLESNIFNVLTNLRKLDLSSNHFASCECKLFDGLTHLLVLDLSRNLLTILPTTIFSELRSLHELRLHGNHLTSLPAYVFARLQRLRILLLYDNVVGAWGRYAFAGLPCLAQLRLDGNHITSFPPNVFDHMPQLSHLSLGKNLLATLPKHVFDPLSNLTILWLDHNSFTSLPEDIFNNLPFLNVLWLQSNRFEVIPCAVVTLPRSISLDLHDNPFHPNLCLPEPWRSKTGMVHHCKEELNIFPCTRQIVNCDAKARDVSNNCNEEVAMSCSKYRCPVCCRWSQWSEWTDHCEGDCGLATATKMRLRSIEQPPLHGGVPCEGASVEAVNCNFPTCNATMYCEGSLLESAFTKEIFKERRRTCHEQCIKKCTVEDLCGDAPIHRDEMWVDPKWTLRWFGTTLSMFMAEVALGDSFEYPTVPSKYQPCLWLLPTCAQASDCKMGAPFKKPTVVHLIDHFYRWYFSEGKINARKSAGSPREAFSIGGSAMKSEDAKDPARARCKSRCLSWCYESCSCNWGWEFPWSNDIDMGWKHQKPMRFKWIPSARWNPGYGTWKCVSPEGEPLRSPWDKPFWSMDIYSDDVKKMYEHFAPLKFHLVCDHVKVFYAMRGCGTKVTKCPLNCTRAAQPVVDYLYEQSMLHPVYMQKGGKKRRAQLVEQLHAGIHSSCRRTCAEVHAPSFLDMYPK